MATSPLITQNQLFNQQRQNQPLIARNQLPAAPPNPAQPIPPPPPANPQANYRPSIALMNTINQIGGGIPPSQQPYAGFVEVLPNGDERIWMGPESFRIRSKGLVDENLANAQRFMESAQIDPTQFSQLTGDQSILPGYAPTPLNPLQFINGPGGPGQTAPIAQPPGQPLPPGGPAPTGTPGQPNQAQVQQNLVRQAPQTQIAPDGTITYNRAALNKQSEDAGKPGFNWDSILSIFGLSPDASGNYALSPAINSILQLILLGGGIADTFGQGQFQADLQRSQKELLDNYTSILQTYGDAFPDLLNQTQRTNELYTGSLETQQGVQQQLADLLDRYSNLSGADIASGIRGQVQPLNLALTQNVGNQVQGALAQRGLSQAPGMFTAEMAQALAPFAQQNLQLGQDAYFSGKRLPLEVPQGNINSPIPIPPFPTLPDFAQPNFPNLIGLIQGLQPQTPPIQIGPDGVPIPVPVPGSGSDNKPDDNKPDKRRPADPSDVPSKPPKNPDPSGTTTIPPGEEVESTVTYPDIPGAGEIQLPDGSMVPLDSDEGFQAISEKLRRGESLTNSELEAYQSGLNSGRHHVEPVPVPGGSPELSDLPPSMRSSFTRDPSTGEVFGSGHYAGWRVDTRNPGHFYNPTTGETAVIRDEFTGSKYTEGLIYNETLNVYRDPVTNRVMTPEKAGEPTRPKWTTESPIFPPGLYSYDHAIGAWYGPISGYNTGLYGIQVTRWGWFGQDGNIVSVEDSIPEDDEDGPSGRISPRSPFDDPFFNDPGGIPIDPTYRITYP